MVSPYRVIIPEKKSIETVESLTIAGPAAAMC